MYQPASLILEDGSLHEGYSIGANAVASGEVVFATGMVGYQEMLTDPSYAGQIVVPTYPLIGNYGINDDDFESQRIRVAGLVVREECRWPSHSRSTRGLDDFLRAQGIPGIGGVDTRALVRRLRTAGVMTGMITPEETRDEAASLFERAPRYDSTDFVLGVTTKHSYRWGPSSEGPGPSIVVLDCGLKYNILRILSELDCAVTVVPCTLPADAILNDLSPDGVVLSPGPGDPAPLGYLEPTVRRLVAAKLTLGICLGHQLIGRAFGAKTFKLKFGHRGLNHPVMDLESRRVHITAQNHGYAIDGDTVKNGLEISQVSLNDGTVEGLRHRDWPLLSVQYHPEASPGPKDSVYLFDRFLGMIGKKDDRRRPIGQRCD